MTHEEKAAYKVIYQTIQFIREVYNNPELTAQDLRAVNLNTELTSYLTDEQIRTLIIRKERADRFADLFCQFSDTTKPHVLDMVTKLISELKGESK